MGSQNQQHLSVEMEVKYTFVNTNKKIYDGIDSNEIQQLLIKWSIKNRMNIQTFCFNEQFHINHKTEFVKAFFSDPVVASTLENVNSANEWVPVGVKAESVEIEKIPCTVTSMEFFDRIKEAGLVSSGGHIMKCLEEPTHGFEVWDELRRMLLNEDSDYIDLFSKSEKDEFIFRLLFHLCMGGKYCQYEDYFEPYLNATKLIYKDLISVAKDPETKKLIPTSIVFKVVAKTANGQQYFPRDAENPQNFCYLLIEPYKRVVTSVIHQFGSSF